MEERRLDTRDPVHVARGLTSARDADIADALSSGGNSGSRATSLIIRALALQEVRPRDWWRIALREAPTGLTLGSSASSTTVPTGC